LISPGKGNGTDGQSGGNYCCQRQTIFIAQSTSAMGRKFPSHPYSTTDSGIGLFIDVYPIPKSVILEDGLKTSALLRWVLSIISRGNVPYFEWQGRHYRRQNHSRKL